MKERDKHFEFIFNGKERNDCKEQNIILGQQKLILSKEKKIDSLIKSTKELIISKTIIMKTYRLSKSKNSKRLLTF